MYIKENLKGVDEAKTYRVLRRIQVYTSLDAKVIVTLIKFWS